MALKGRAKVVDLSGIEAKVKELISRCETLKEENQGLKTRCAILQAKNSKAKKSLETMLKRLKSLVGAEA